MNTRMIPWLAGLLEGEGSFIVVRKSVPYSYVGIRILLQMTDRDVVERAKEVSGGLGGSINLVERSRNGHKDIYGWNVNKLNDAYALMVAVYPFMGERRRKDIEKCIEVWRSVVLRYGRPACSRGHLFTPENTIIRKSDSRRVCRTCQNASRRRYYERQKQKR